MRGKRSRTDFVRSRCVIRDWVPSLRTTTNKDVSSESQKCGHRRCIEHLGQRCSD